MHSTRALPQLQNASAGFRNSRNSSSQLPTSLNFDNQYPHTSQLDLELSQLNPTPPSTPVRRTRYLPELDMEIEIIEQPRKAIVNKDIRVRALREHWDEKEIRPTYPHSSRPRPLSPLRFELSTRRM